MSLIPANIVLSTTALLAWNNPWTETHSITASLTQHQVGTRLFSDEAPIDVEGLYLNSTPSHDVGFFLDPYWGRIIFSQKEGNYIKAFGGGGSAGPSLHGITGMASDSRGRLFLADGSIPGILKLQFWPMPHPLPHMITHEATYTLPQFQHPTDISVAMNGEPLNPAANRLWVVDDFEGKIFELDMNGEILRTVTHYTSSGGTYRLRLPTKIVASESWYSGAPYIAFIDRERNAFVVADANSITGNTIAASQATQFTQSGSLLIAVGQDIAGEWWATDTGLGCCKTRNWQLSSLAAIIRLSLILDKIILGRIFHLTLPPRLRIFAADNWEVASADVHSTIPRS
jgi:hypothetical protein